MKHGTKYTTHLLGNALNCCEIPLTGKGKTSLDHIHSEPRQLLGNCQFFLQVEARTRGLLTIPEGGVEYQDATWILGHNDIVSAGLVGMTMSCPTLVQAEEPEIGLHSAFLWVNGL